MNRLTTPTFPGHAFLYGFVGVVALGALLACAWFLSYPDAPRAVPEPANRSGGELSDQDLIRLAESRLALLRDLDAQVKKLGAEVLQILSARARVHLKAAEATETRRKKENVFLTNPRVVSLIRSSMEEEFEREKVRERAEIVDYLVNRIATENPELKDDAEPLRTAYMGAYAEFAEYRLAMQDYPKAERAEGIKKIADQLEQEILAKLGQSKFDVWLTKVGNNLRAFQEAEAESARMNAERAARRAEAGLPEFDWMNPR